MTPSPPLSRACVLALFSVFLATGRGAFGASTDTHPAKSDVSATPATKLDPFTVEEPVSEKTHTLFMGADIAINLDRDIYKVSDVHGSNWVVVINGYDKEISAKRSPVSLKITPNLKLTENAATITGFTRTQSYSFGNDPRVLLTRGLSKTSAMNTDLLSVSNDAQARVETQQNYALAGANILAGADNQFSASAELETAMFAYSDTHPNPNIHGLTFGASPGAVSTNTDTTGAYSTEYSRALADGLRAGTNLPIVPTHYLAETEAETMQRSADSQTENGNESGKIASAGLDAMNVHFDIRSAKPLRDPYVVTMTRFHPYGSKPGVVQDLVYAKSLDPIDQHISHIEFEEDGFPPNYEFVDFQIHVYNRGVEIATNVARDRVELTRDEAFDYLKVEYFGTHLHDTLPATPAMAKFPSDLPAKLAEGKYHATVYVKVSQEGRADEAFADPECRKPIGDPYLDSVVQRIRFKPALKNGSPTQGVAGIDLSKISL